MTDVATTTDQPGQQVDLLSTNPEYRRLAALYNECAKLARSKFVPTEFKDDTDTVFALARYGEQYGLSPIHSVARLYVISGKIEPSADVLAALVMEHGHELRYDETSSERCTVSIRRVGTDYWQSLTWTIDDARRAGLLDLWVVRWVATDGGKKYPEEFIVGHVDTGVDEARVAGAPEWVQKDVQAGRLKSKDNWAKYPDDLLAAKAIRRAVKRFCPDVLLNLADQGEGVDVAALAAPDASAVAPTEQAAEPDQHAAGDEDIVDAELVDEAAPDDVPAPAPPEPPADDDTVQAAEAERRARLQRGLMATATKAFPKDTNLTPAEQRARATAQRHAIAYVALGVHKSANDMTADELAKVTMWLDHVVDGRVRLEERDGTWVAIMGDREVAVPAEQQAA